MQALGWVVSSRAPQGSIVVEYHEMNKSFSRNLYTSGKTTSIFQNYILYTSDKLVLDATKGDVRSLFVSELSATIDSLDAILRLSYRDLQDKKDSPGSTFERSSPVVFVAP